MLASCLHPYRDSRGRFYPSILPFLVRRFPADQAVEVLRSNLVRGGGSGGGGNRTGDEQGTWDPREGLEELVLRAGRREALGERGDDDDEEMGDGGGEKDKGKGKGVSGWGVEMEVDETSAAPEASANPFATVVGCRGAQEEPAVPPLKRKSEVAESDAGKPPKRVDTGIAAAQVAVMPKRSRLGRGMRAMMRAIEEEEEEEDDDE
ncbi:hypothetical protein NEMBOFW57_000452 [Staphylotrichum longicolle]|uniref:Uncharacterized protein n=1 Tax=Staphylotrichum longicolle TaxID=669026 RepID=A0AAD4F0G7_9PEZI|nr:hypothetical protein NEMBOFW57_000452 [Staphylotrichum longicolle]